MIFKRQQKQKSRKEQKDLITWRGHEVTRIEAFSDAIFAFAVTLLVVSLEVPKSYEELWTNMKGFVPFAISFTIFFQIWSTQNEYFRRFGMHDEFTLRLNAILLFLVLFFVYPLKFLWNALFLKNVVIDKGDEVVKLFCLYSGGFAAIYFLFAIMYWHAHRRRAHLGLTASEAFTTKTDMYQHMAMGSIGLLSCLLALGGNKMIPFAGMSYVLIWPTLTILHIKRGRAHRVKYENIEVMVTEEEKIPVGEEVETE